MNEHDKALISYLRTHQGSGIGTLAGHLGVRERTAFTYIKHANAEISSSARIVFQRGGSCGDGYYLNIDDEETFQKLLMCNRTLDGLPQTPQERVGYLLNDLLSRSDWITLDALSEVLYVSRAALSSDLRAVERSLGRFGLKLERRPHYGLRVVGSEMARRLCLADATISRLRRPDASAADDMSLENEDDVLSGFSNRDYVLGVVSTCVSETLDEAHLKINSLVCV